LVKHGEVQLIDSHLTRLAHSAQYLGIPFDRSRTKHYILETWIDYSLTSNPSSQYRLRIDLSPLGELSHSLSELNSLPDSVKLFWAKDILPDPTHSVMQSQDSLLRHKSHSRTWYDRAWQLSESQGGFDALFTNEAGFVTEGGRSSVFIQKTNTTEWLTPPLTAGLLPGVMRAQLLGDPSWNAREANLTIEDVLLADKIVITNALRGAVPAHF
jgi:para-aminobenzoate synthetase/4-amino-4-deoxychorismate lyase